MRRDLPPPDWETATCKEMAMDGKSKLRALGLALAMVASAAGTGWALHLPLTAVVADAGAVDMPTPAGTPVPGVSLSAWPQPVTQADGRAPVSVQGVGAEAYAGLEAMSATGAAAVQQ
jgi:hypothetical protein